MAEFGEFAHNINPLDANPHYYHMFSGTTNYLILPLNSVTIDTAAILTQCRHAKPLVEAMTPFLYMRWRISRDHIFNTIFFNTNFLTRYV